jgi:glycosyltransferase involved in cell wall biosynthesis
MSGLLDRIEGRTLWGEVDVQGRLSRRLSPARQAAEADLRRLSVARVSRLGLRRLLRARLHPGTWYLNVGHSNITPKVLGAMSDAGAQVAVMLHDTIPLDLPEDHAPETVERFRARVETVKAYADLVLTPSQDVSDAIGATHGMDATALPLGVTLAAPEALPPDLQLTRPYFVTLGTIDARKNAAFLVDLWRSFGSHRPMLCLAGQRGWMPADMAERFAELPTGVIEQNSLSDGQVATLIEGSAGLLHPSKAEGFGFPLLEALLRGVPVLANDLAVYRETAGDNAVYLPQNDHYQWQKAIEALAGKARQGAHDLERRPERPTWTTHLNLLLTHLREAGPR